MKSFRYFPSVLSPSTPPPPSALILTMTTRFCTEALQTETSVIAGGRSHLPNRFFYDYGYFFFLSINAVCVWKKSPFCNDCCHVYSLFYVLFYDYVTCQRGLFISGVCLECLKILLLSLLQVNSTVFLGFLIYCIV